RDQSAVVGIHEAAYGVAHAHSRHCGAGELDGVAAESTLDQAGPVYEPADARARPHTHATKLDGPGVGRADGEAARRLVRSHASASLAQVVDPGRRHDGYACDLGHVAAALLLEPVHHAAGGRKAVCAATGQ